MNNFIGIIISAIYIAFVIVSSKFVNKFGEEASRKYVHILLSNVWIIYLFFIDSMWAACVLPIAFVFINLFSYKFKLIKSIEREKNDGLGTVYYAVSMLIASIISYGVGCPIVGASGILIMGYGDGLAAIVGKKIKSQKYKMGSLTMFIISLVISFIVLKIIGIKYLFLDAICIAVVSTILEAVSIKGLDNITVPVIVTILTLLAV